MSFLRNVTRGLRSLFRKEQVDRELDEELRAYQEMAVEEKTRSRSASPTVSSLHIEAPPQLRGQHGADTIARSKDTYANASYSVITPVSNLLRNHTNDRGHK